MINKDDAAMLTAKELVDVLRNPKTAKIVNLIPSHYKALEDLASIFDQATATRITKKNNTLQRVQSKLSAPTESIDATLPSHIKSQTILHQQKTRANTPIDHQALNNNQPIKNFQTPKTNIPTKITPRKKVIIPPFLPITNLYESKTRQNKPHIIPLDDDLPPKPRRSQRQIFSTSPPSNIAQAAIYQFMVNAITSSSNSTRPRSCEQKELITHATSEPLNLEHVCNGVVHPITGEIITKYTKLVNDPVTKETWQKAFCVELGRLAQGYGNTPGTNTVRFMDYDMIKGIPQDHIVTYARIVVD